MLRDCEMKYVRSESAECVEVDARNQSRRKLVFAGKHPRNLRMISIQIHSRAIDIFC